MRTRDITAAADDLQRAMLPRSLPEVPGWRVDAHYAPAGAGRVGGDWYDAFRIGPDCLALVIGDVAGHGLEAASDMAQLRNALRAYLLDGPEPADALERLDRLMAELMPDSVATVACVVVDLERAVARVAHAGHPPGQPKEGRRIQILLWVGRPRPRIRYSIPAALLPVRHRQYLNRD